MFEICFIKFLFDFLKVNKVTVISLKILVYKNKEKSTNKE